MSTADTQQVPKARGSAGQPGGRTVFLLVTISLNTICVTGNIILSLPLIATLHYMRIICEKAAAPASLEGHSIHKRWPVVERAGTDLYAVRNIVK